MRRRTGRPPWTGCGCFISSGHTALGVLLVPLCSRSLLNTQNGPRAPLRVGRPAKRLTQLHCSRVTASVGFRDDKTEAEKLSNFPKIAQLGGAGAGVWAKAVISRPWILSLTGPPAKHRALHCPCHWTASPWVRAWVSSIHI